MQTSDMIVVLTNAPDETTASEIAEKLVMSGVAACVNCLPAVQSIYRWRGAVERTKEIPLLVKAPCANYAEIERVIREAHPYDVPEIIALPIIEGLPAYLQWLDEETVSGQ